MRTRVRLVLLAAIFAVALAVRALYAVSLEASIYTAAQPGTRMSSRYDQAAVDILHGEGILWPRHPDPSRTGLMARPPGYALALASIYATFHRSFFAVQVVQNVLTSLGCVLLAIAGARLFGWPTGILAGLMAALSPHLGLVSAFVLADALCAVPLIGALAALALAHAQPSRRRAWLWSAAAGILVGVGVWLRPNVLLLAPFLAVVLVLVNTDRRRGTAEAAALVLATVAVVAPITLRNYVVFHEFVPVSINGGLPLWHGVFEAGGEAAGAHRGDKQVAAEEAVRYGNPRYAEWWAEPDGVFRDHERFRRAKEVILAHPAQYAGLLLRRMGAMLDLASGEAPVVSGPMAATLELGEAGSARQLGGLTRHPDDERYLWLGHWAEPLRTPIGWLQGLLVRALLPLSVIGAAVLARLDWRRAAILLALPAYYLCTEPFFIFEWRVSTPMHYPLFVAAAAAVVWAAAALWNRVRRAVPA